MDCTTVFAWIVHYIEQRYLSENTRPAGNPRTRQTGLYCTCTQERNFDVPGSLL